MSSGEISGADLIAEENVDGWVLGNAQRDQSDRNLKAGKLWDYVRQVGAYRCPGDESRVSGRPGQRRFRSYALDASLNLEGVPGSGIRVPPEALPGGNLRRDSEAYVPASNFGFLDVSEASIHSGGIGIADPEDWIAGPFYWIHQPGERHRSGANLSFLDGHVKAQRWRFTPKIYAPGARNRPQNEADYQDLMWLKDRTHLGQHRLRVLGLL